MNNKDFKVPKMQANAGTNVKKATKRGLQHIYIYGLNKRREF